MTLRARFSHAIIVSWVAWSLSLWALEAFGILWTRTSLNAVLGALGLAALGIGVWAAQRSVHTTDDALSHPDAPSSAFDWLEQILCSGIFAIFALGTYLGWNTMSDFVFHWGIKAKRFALTGGIDYPYLAPPRKAPAHPDYPNLIPTLYASLMLWTGDDSWQTVSWISILAFGLLLLAGRELAALAVTSPLERFLVVIGVSSACLAFAIRPMIAGGGDLFIALAITLGSCALLRPPSRESDSIVAWTAALAASAKIEGIVVAGTLIALHVLRGRPRGSALSERLKSAARSAWVTVLVVAYWLYRVIEHGLFLESNTGTFDPDRALLVLSHLGGALLEPFWHGFPFVLLGLPLLFFDPQSRRPAVLIAIQLIFYIYVYMAGPVDVELWIQTSASRLFFHLGPASAVLLVGMALRKSTPGEPS